MTAKYKIERGVPVPDAYALGPKCKYPWKDMRPGDSVLVTRTDTDRRHGTSSAANSAYAWVRRHRPGWRAIARTDRDATRIWFIDTSEDSEP